MNIIRIRKKIPKYLFFPLSLLLLFALYSAYQIFEEKLVYKKTRNFMHYTLLASKLIHEFQKERGYSRAFVSVKGKSLNKELHAQRKLSDKRILQLQNFIYNFNSDGCSIEFKQKTKIFLKSLKDLPEKRNLINMSLQYDGEKYYSQIIQQLLKLISFIVPISHDDKLVNLTESYVVILKMKEQAGQERALVSKVLGKKLISHDEFYKLGQLIASQNVYLNFFKTMALQKHKNMLYASSMQAYDNEIQEYRENISSRSLRNSILLNIRKYIGYGGLVHNFKNYVIRGNKEYEKKVKNNYESLYKEIKKYRQLEGITQEEKNNLKIIEKTFLKYLNFLDYIALSHAKGEHIKELDFVVKVDDSSALHALKSLENNIYGSMEDWFTLATKRMNYLHQIEILVAQDINKFVDEYNNILTLKIVLHILLLILIIGVMITAGIMLQELVESGKMLNRAQVNTRSGSYEYYFRDNLLFWSDEYYNLLEVDKDSFEPTKKAFKNFIFKRDYAKVKRSLQEAINTKKITYVEYRVLLNNKKTLYMRSSFEIIRFDNFGKPLIVVGTMTDISQSKALEQEIVDTQKDVIMTMAAIGESRSKETGEHVKRVAEYSKLLAELCGESTERVELIKMASPMHDIGKVAIPDDILNKPAKLTPQEWKIMQTHSDLGYEMLKHSKREILQLAATIAYTHHEYYDGSGYPRGIKGEDIPLVGRIVGLVDVFDALGSDRCYKNAWEIEKIIDYIREEKGKMFDPYLVELFLENIDYFVQIRNAFKDNKDF